MPGIKIFNVGNTSVNQYLLVSQSHRLLIDSGFPDSLNNLGREMRQTGFKIRDIDFLIVTHFHIDHAGAIQDIKNRGVTFVLFDIQQPFIKPMERMAKDKWKYISLTPDDNLVLRVEEARAFLNTINIDGRIIATPGHTRDSITLLLDSGEAFIGDLTAEYLLMKEEDKKRASWKKLKQAGIEKAFPGHGQSYLIE